MCGGSYSSPVWILTQHYLFTKVRPSERETDGRPGMNARAREQRRINPVSVQGRGGVLRERPGWARSSS